MAKAPAVSLRCSHPLKEVTPMADGPEVPEDLAKVATEKGIPLDLMRRALALGFPAEAVKQQISLPGATAEAAEAFISEQERIRAGGEITVPENLAQAAAKHDWPLDLVKRALALGAQPDALLMQIESGTRGDIPDEWPYQTEMPRGAYPIAGVPAMGYSIYEKAELWAENVSDLYEEAIQRRWRPATDIPWETVQPLPDEIERSLCQVCTYLCEKALLAGDVVGKWLPEMSYGYHEVKLYLATAEFDAARQFEVFRKRALSNGGGMGMQSPGYFHRAIIDARGWTETSTVLHILSNSWLMGLYQVGEYVAHNEAESLIFRLCMQDVGRQLAYGAQHLKYFLMRKLDRREEVHSYLNKAEAVMVYDEEKDTPLREALIILLGGGVAREQILDGVRKLEYFKRRWVRDYLARLAAAGLPERRERIHPLLKKYVEEPVAQAA